MTALTTAQLDELDDVNFVRKLKWDKEAYLPMGTFDRLVAIARAALAWSETHDELQGAHYMAVAGADPGPARERYGQAIAALQKALEGEP